MILRGHSDAELYLGDEILEICRNRGAILFHVAGGRPMLEWATDSWDVEVLAVLGSRELLATPGFWA